MLSLKRAIIFILATPIYGFAQVTVATGDARTVTEPVYPPVCTQVAATKYIVKTNAVNIDPYNPTCGSTGGTNGVLGCTGGTDYQPSLFANTYSAAENPDNTTASGGAGIQTALNNCTPGQAVELVPGAGGQRGFVLKPWNIPTGVSLIIDTGIHVFASRNLPDYAGNNCGAITNSSSHFCTHWITSPNTAGSGIYGNGILDGRAWDAYIGTTTQSFSANRVQAYCNNHGGATNGSPACTVDSQGVNSYGPNIFGLVNSNNFTLYHVTLKDAGNFNLSWKSSNGGTFWDTKILGPFEVANTDGFDPIGSTNGTYTHGFISNGDNMASVKADVGPASNITISNNQTGAGIAIAIGVQLQHNITNVLVTDNVQRGNLFDSRATGLEVISNTAFGGVADTITFQNDCMVNEKNSILVSTNFLGQTGTGPDPVYHNLLFRGITVLKSTTPYTTGKSGLYTFQGISGSTLGIQMDNIDIQGTNEGVKSQSGVNTDRNLAVFLGPGTVDTSLLAQLAVPPATAVTLSGTPSTSTPYACTTSMWKPLIGELNMKTALSNNNQSSIGSSPFTLQVMLEPATAINSKESPALAATTVTFLDNGTPIGTAPISGDGTYAEFAVSSPPSGVHTYSAQYPGDTNYPVFTFGSVQLVNGGTTRSFTGNLKLSGHLTIQSN